MLQKRTQAMISDSSRTGTYFVSDRFQIDISFEVRVATQMNDDGVIVAKITHHIGEILVIDTSVENLAFKVFEDLSSAFAFLLENGTSPEELGRAMTD